MYNGGWHPLHQVLSAHEVPAPKPAPDAPKASATLLKLPARARNDTSSLAAPT